MSIIKINAITVPKGLGDEVARRFADTASAVDGIAGFEGFELMRPTDEREAWLVVTRWADEDAFNAWVRSPEFAEGHRAALSEAKDRPEPLPLSAELWSYVVEVSRPGNTA